MKTVFVLVIWFGSSHGGPLAIDDFSSLVACGAFVKRVIAKQNERTFGVLKGFGGGYSGHLCEEKETAQ